MSGDQTNDGLNFKNAQVGFGFRSSRFVEYVKGGLPDGLMLINETMIRFLLLTEVMLFL